MARSLTCGSRGWTPDRAPARWSTWRGGASPRRQESIARDRDRVLGGLRRTQTDAWQQLGPYLVHDLIERRDHEQRQERRRDHATDDRHAHRRAERGAFAGPE